MDRSRSKVHSAMGGFLIDLDGTLYHGSRKIEGADRLISELRKQGLPYRYVTNNSAASPAAVAGRLAAMGIKAEPEDVCTSAQAAAQYIARQKAGASVFVIGEQGLKQAVEEAGLLLVEDQQPDYVLQGIDRELTYGRVARAVRYIREGALSIMTNPDLLLPGEGGLQPGAGSIGAMIEAASGAVPAVIGKPSGILMDFALQKLGVQTKEAWVIGDNLATDIAAGIASGCGTALVLTGLTTRENYEEYARKAGCRPDLIFANLDELKSHILTCIGT